MKTVIDHNCVSFWIIKHVNVRLTSILYKCINWGSDLNRDNTDKSLSCDFSHFAILREKKQTAATSSNSVFVASHHNSESYGRKTPPAADLLPFCGPLLVKHDIIVRIIIACLRAQLCHLHHFPSVPFIPSPPQPWPAARSWQMHADFCSCALTCRLGVNETWGASSRAAKKRGPYLESDRSPAARFGPHKGRLNVAWHTDLLLLLRCSIFLWRVCNPVDLRNRSNWLQDLCYQSVRKHFVIISRLLQLLTNYVKSRISGWKSQVWKTHNIFFQFMKKWLH